MDSDENVDVLWDFGDGTIESANKFPTHTYVNSGVFNIKATINSELYCNTPITFNKVVTIQQGPTALFEFFEDTLYTGVPYDIFNQSEPRGSSTNTDYVWSFNNQTLFG